MTQKSSFFNSVNGDRNYQASDYAEYFNSLVTNGIFPNPGTNLQVLANGNMTVTVKAGPAWINGYHYANDSDLSIPVDVADGILNRIDRVVIRLDALARNITAVVKKGTFASSPVAPTLQRDADVWELGTADIYIIHGATSLSQVNITDLRMNTGLCGWVNSLIQADTTAIFNQYLDWYTSRQAVYDVDFLGWTSTKQQSYDDWYAITTTTAETDVANFESQFQADFTEWFTIIQSALDGETAGNLLNLINGHADNVNNPHEVSTGQIGAETPAGAQAKADTVQANLVIHSVDNTKHIPTGGTTGQILQKQGSNFGFVDLPPSKDADNGRYQSEFGFDGGVLSNCISINANIGLDVVAPTQLLEQLLGDDYWSVYSNIGAGQRLDNVFTADMSKIYSVGIYVVDKTGAPPSLRVSIYDETSSLVLGSKSIIAGSISGASMNTFTFDTPISVTQGHIIQIRVDTAGLGDSSNRYRLNFITTETQNNSFFIETSNLWTGKTDRSYDLRYSITYEQTLKYLSGTIIKTLTPSPLKKYGNLKFAKTTPVNTSVVCDILADIFGSSIPLSFLSSTSVGSNIDRGIVIVPNTNLTGVHCELDNRVTLPVTARIIKVSDGSILTSISISTAIFDLNATLLTGVEYAVFVLHQVGDTSVYDSVVAYPYTSADFNISGGWNLGVKLLTNKYSFVNMTVIKDTAIKLNVISIADLSDIDPITYPILKTRWTLTRNAITDATPTVSDPSWTWEGGLGMIQPTLPQTVRLLQTPVVGVYYTLVNIPKGKGILNRISLTGASQMTSLQLRVTVDGGTSVIIAPSTGYSEAISPRKIVANTPMNSDFHSYSFDLIANSYFKQSLLVEIVSSGTGQFDATLNYAIA